jgi:hypothetical protein
MASRVPDYVPFIQEETMHPLKSLAVFVALVAPLPAAAGAVTVLDAGAPAEQAVVRFEASKEGVSVGLVQATDVDQAANVMIIEKFYEEICTAPCTFALDAGWHELHFEYRKQEWTKKVQVKAGVQELFVRPLTPVGATGYGLTLWSGGLLFPVGLPMWIGGASRVKVRETDVATISAAQLPGA